MTTVLDQCCFAWNKVIDMPEWAYRSWSTRLGIRVGPKSSLTQTKLSEHETNRGEAEKSECVSGEIFEILGQAATAIEPREGALDNPASRQKLKPFGVIGAVDDFDFEVR